VDKVRVDRWLAAARVYKSRTLATEACNGGHVRVNGVPAAAHMAVRIGDEVRALAPSGVRVLGVVALAEKRLSPPAARALYEDRSPPPPPREVRVRVAVREPGAGRPTKRERRDTDRIRGRFS
jgi:ribosome-associated heat shock protein Hsp15